MEGREAVQPLRHWSESRTLFLVFTSKTGSSALKMLGCDLLLWSPSGHSLMMSRKCTEVSVLMKLNNRAVERNISLYSCRNLWHISQNTHLRVHKKY